MSAEIAVGSVAINILGLAMPLILIQIYDRIIPNQGTSTLAVLAAGVTTALVAEAMLKIARQRVLGLMATRFEVGLSTRAVEHLMRADLAAFEAVSPGRSVERLNAVPRLRDYGSGQSDLTRFDLPFAVGYFALIALLGGLWVAAVSVAGFVLLATAAIPASRKARAALTRTLQTDDERYNFLVATLSGLMTMKMMGLERPLTRRFEYIQVRHLEQQRAATLATQHLNETAQAVSQVTTIGTVCLGGMMVLGGAMTVGALSACTLLVGRFLQLSQGIITASSRQQGAAVARSEIESVLALPRGPTFPADGADATATIPTLRLDGVSLRFGDGPPVLEDASFCAGRGDIVGIVGANGSGKSTLLALIAGLYPPGTGRIELDGQPLSAYSEASLRRAIALVPQQETLFSGTILDNITHFHPEMIEPALAASARTGLDDLVMALPQGYATPVGEGASESLPRGVAQRVALTRALAQQPRILLFDDANSAVDDSGDLKVAEIFADVSREGIVLLVSHRPSILKQANRVLRLADGRADLLEGLGG